MTDFYHSICYYHADTNNLLRERLSTNIDIARELIGAQWATCKRWNIKAHYIALIYPLPELAMSKHDMFNKWRIVDVFDGRWLSEFYLFPSDLPAKVDY